MLTKVYVYECDCGKVGYSSTPTVEKCSKCGSEDVMVVSEIGEE